MNTKEHLLRSRFQFLEDVPNLRVLFDVAAAQYCTIATGGNLSLLAEPQDLESLVLLVNLLLEHQASYRILGAGSNLLIPDQGIESCVIRLGKGFRFLRQLGRADRQLDGDVKRFEVGGSYSLMSLSRELSDQGLTGLEFAGGIPASLGGAVIMNAGAHDGDMSQIIESISVVDSGGEVQSLSKESLEFAYRTSHLPKDSIVVSAIIKLTQSDISSTKTKRAEFLKERKLRQPLSMPSFGSVFKNPLPQKPAGALIEAAGLKSFKIGGAEISSLHANWIVNPEKKAKTSDVLALIEKAQAAVYNEVGIKLQPEVIRWNCTLN